jgi:hypothetical protein
VLLGYPRDLIERRVRRGPDDVARHHVFNLSRVRLDVVGRKSLVLRKQQKPSRAPPFLPRGARDAQFRVPVCRRIQGEGRFGAA